ncbi:MAG TPA: 2-phosphosulfolactate phosphatase [Candidatus Fimadaptatus faecigallinarum]|uniref:Probable 2-phosphosulfolactate phosphatase n=1 Tax=Candidatus Fimadaptatus faecigallinarum TaxID=2840814 RepID=A0A9D1S4R0_9FIRM|nr:2-phosphosulfolactate phosphatase [Candidatus Fimadaptatus faecigallinarum]
MNVSIFELIEGSRQAEGLTVIIDVFRAFSLECYIYARGARKIIPVGDLEQAFALKRAQPDCVLIGERKGKKCEGCDFGNSPSQTEGFDFTGRTVIHTTSAGTQGVVNAVHASEILVAGLVNARATADYIRKCAPDKVSLVAMGTNGVASTEEDVLCARYIRSLLLDEPLDIAALAPALRETSGRKFFNPDTQEIFPEADFEMCIQYDRFPFALRIEKDASGLFVTRRVDVQ